jgi:UDP-N-acetylmuramate--alanine ligase
MQLEKIKHIHFVGIKGVGMTSLALCAQDLGIRVTGSDVEEIFVTDPVLEKRKIEWKLGFKKENLKPLPDLVITTGAHGGLKNIEVVAAKKKGIPVMTHAEGLSFFAKGKKTVTVCGVGGKTTISSMMVVVLDAATKHPSFAVGVGEIFPIGYPGRYDKMGEHFICEADEFAISPGIDDRPRFSFLDPEVIVVTNIEHDHPDIYPSLEQTKKTFGEFFEKISENGLLVADFDNQNTREVIKKVDVPIQTFGFSKNADWQIRKIMIKNGKNSFSLVNKSGEKVDLVLRVPGQYNVKNAAAVFIVSRFLGLKIEQIQKGLYKSTGSKRRFEKVGKSKSGALVYDDYAHHPTQIKSVLSAAKGRFPKKRLISLFQPHTYTRTKALFDQFAKSFGQADIALFMDIYASAREFKDETVSSKALAKEVSKHKKESYYVGNHQGATRWLKKHTGPEDLILTLGAGDVFYIFEDLLGN